MITGSCAIKSDEREGEPSWRSKQTEVLRTPFERRALARSSRIALSIRETRTKAFNMTAKLVIQQLREAFPDRPTHRHLILDNDAIFSADVARMVATLGIHLQRMQSPWQNGTAERFVGTVRRELLDHVVVLSEDHLRRLLREYVEYYNTDRVHTSIGDSPAGRSSETKPSCGAGIIRVPRVGGLHGRYSWRDAA
jgi:transposase InsO family protein